MERWQSCSSALFRLLTSAFAQLRRAQPDPAEHDVTWHGPHWVRSSRRERWCPTRFSIYDGQLFGSVRVGTQWHLVVWRIGARKVRFEERASWGMLLSEESLWLEVLTQVRDRMRRALRDPERYHRFVSRVLPPDCRVGLIQRHWTWPRGVRAAMPLRTIDRAAAAIDAGRVRPPWPEMTLGRLRTCEAAAYDSAFPKVRKLGALEKRKRLADTRDGGMLALPLDDAEAFAQWFRGRTWAGTHPFEIVFANPHGILLSPHEADGGWRLYLAVDNEGLYTHTLRMAIALHALAAPFELLRADKVIAAVRGDDGVEVSPDLYSVRYAELVQQRPQAARHIRWEPVRRIEPITEEQAARLARELSGGSKASPRDEAIAETSARCSGRPSGRRW